MYDVRQVYIIETSRGHRDEEEKEEEANLSDDGSDLILVDRAVNTLVFQVVRGVPAMKPVGLAGLTPTLVIGVLGYSKIDMPLGLLALRLHAIDIVVLVIVIVITPKPRTRYRLVHLRVLQTSGYPIRSQRDTIPFDFNIIIISAAWSVHFSLSFSSHSSSNLARIAAPLYVDSFAFLFTSTFTYRKDFHAVQTSAPASDIVAEKKNKVPMFERESIITSENLI